MTTALDVVKGALGFLGVLGAGESPSAEDGADGLALLNTMMRGFPTDGIDYAHTTMTALADAVPMPDECEMHLQFMLAAYWAPKFGKTPNPMVIERADNGRRYLQGRYRALRPVRIDAGLDERRYGSMTLNEWTRG